MSDFEEKLDRILSDPQAMNQIMTLAKTLGGGPASSPPSRSEAPQPAPPEAVPFEAKLLGRAASLLEQCNSGNDDRIALLTALRPFVSEKRYSRLDKAMEIARLSRMVRMALELLKNEEGDHV